MLYILYFFITIIFSKYLFNFFINYAKKKKFIDDKNPHYANQPTPSGAGVFFLIIFFLGNLFFYYTDTNFSQNFPNRYYVFIIALTGLSLISLRDDIKPIDPILRLILQFVLVYISLVSLNINSILLPYKIAILITLIAWIYIINITNFIDGSDGFLITNFIFTCINILIAKHFLEFDFFSYYIAIMILPAALVFLFYNFPPAKIYMGDAGSIFLGFLNGFIFLEFFIEGYYFLALSFFSYILCDCSITLIKKMKKGIMPWVGMYDYYFLIPVLKNKINHAKVLYVIIFFNLVNSMLIFLQIYFDKNMISVINFVLALLILNIFKKFETSKIFNSIFR